MANALIELPVPYIGDFGKGRPIFNGQIYVGVVDLDPEIPANQKQIVGIQENGTEVNLPQPVATSSGGYPTYNGAPIRLAVDGAYSLKILDRKGEQEYYFSNVEQGEPVVFADNPVLYRDTIAIAVADTGLEIGQYITTKGYHSANDGGGAAYIVVAGGTGTDDGGSYLDMANGNQLQLLKTDSFAVNSSVFGVIEAPSQSQQINAALTYSETGVRVPIGGIGVDSTLNITKSAATFSGAGNPMRSDPQGTRFVPDSGFSGDIISITGDGANVSSFRIDGESSTDETAINCDTFYGTTFRDMRIVNVSRAFRFYNGFGAYLDNIYTSNITGAEALLITGDGGGGTTDRTDQVVVFNSTISPGISNEETDCVRVEHFSSSISFTESRILGGFRGLYIPGDATSLEGSFFYITGRGFESNAGGAIVAERGNKFQIRCYAGNTTGNADAALFKFGEPVNEVNITGSEVRGAGRSGVDFAGTSLRIAGSAVVNSGKNRINGTRTITAINDVGGLIQIDAPLNAGNQPFLVGDFVILEGTDGLDAEYEVSAVSGTLTTLANSTYAAASIQGTIRELSSAIFLRSTAENVSIVGNDLGRSPDGLNRADYGLICNTQGEVVFQNNRGVWDNNLGSVKWAATEVDTWPRDKIDDHVLLDGDITIGSIVVGNFFNSGLVLDGIYAIVGVQAKIDVDSVLLRPLRQLDTGTSEYLGTSSLTIDAAVSTGVQNLYFTQPYLAKIGQGYRNVGVRISSITGTPTSLEVKLIVLRIV